jgi:predicted methyltransferase
MKLSRFAPPFVLALSAACGSTPEAAPPPPPPPPAAIEAPPPPAPPPPPAEPTAEEKKKAEAQRELQAFREKSAEEAKAEAARWTPEMHAEAKALAEKGNLKATLAGKHRKPGEADRDKFRHPAETLAFFGFKPTMTVLEFGPGEGWYTRVLAPTLAKKGKLIITGADPNGNPEERSTLSGQRFKAFLDTAPELYGKVETVYIDSKAPKLNHEGDVDMVVVFRELHGMVGRGTLEAWLGEMHKALKPNGIVGVEQHRAKPGVVDVKESAKQGYLPEAWVIDQFKAAGFKLAGKSELNANPKDTKDYPEGVWTLPPNFALENKDREKYAAIGESDRMTLKFVKVAKPK